jgi:alanine racemase
MSEVLKLRPTWAEVDLDAIRWNVRQFKSLVGDSVKVLVAVKADAYGHGAVPVARTCVEAGAEYLGVASVEEGVELRDAGIECPILVLGYAPLEAAPYIVEYGLTQAVYQTELVHALADAAARANRTVKVHIKVDTGMSRIGVLTPEDVLNLAKRILDRPSLQLEGIFTHLSKADEADKSYTYLQLDRWHAVIRTLEREGIQIPIHHVANSAGTIEFPEARFQMVRIGIGAYGCYPSETVDRTSVDLKQALSLYSRIVRLESIPPDYRVGYGGTYNFSQPRRIATVPVGYADGYSRLLSNKAFVLVRGKRVPVAGRVSMDQLMLDVTDVPDVQLGDVVCLYGRQGDAFISLDEVASWMGTISYEVACDLGKRVQRVYRMNSAK